jgi:D-alanyl-D-alanine carboxypeptidase
MDETTLMNASGWPAEGHVMSMHDLGILAERIITEHPEYYTYFAETEFDYETAPRPIGSTATRSSAWGSVRTG